MLTDLIGIGAALTVPQYGVQPLLRYFPSSNKAGKLRYFAETGALYFHSPNLALDADAWYHFNLNGNVDGFRSKPLFRMGLQYFLP